ncbi:MAG: hypothetical protein IPL12_03770 [Bacteroidetes bacterium]|nr:hypothetical protein [Bacteroidota bacterium]
MKLAHQFPILAAIYFFILMEKKFGIRIIMLCPMAILLILVVLTLVVSVSITQGVTILPMPGAENIFYIFQLQSKSDPPNYGLEYSKVDMTMNDGFGEVVEKNIDVFTGYLNEKMQAVKHANGRDWWLTTMQLSTNDTTLCLATFLITADTIEGPFIQCFSQLMLV